MQEGRAVDSFQTTARRYLDARLRTQVLQAIYFPFILFLATCGDAIVLGLGSALVHDGTIAAGTVIAFLLYLDQFFAKLPSFDKEWADRAAREKRNGRVLRYVVTATPRSVSAKLAAVPASSPMGSLEGTRNLIAFTTRRYRNEPLVVSGPGAGPAVTAAGILNDIYSLAGR